MVHKEKTTKKKKKQDLMKVLSNPNYLYINRYSKLILFVKQGTFEVVLIEKRRNECLVSRSFLYYNLNLHV